ncbi:MAG: hypothetical protein O2809_06285 [Proteobacteria bacterium]|nr:hypothetical protein [Pseudomonadota bacterium]
MQKNNNQKKNNNDNEIRLLGFGFMIPRARGCSCFNSFYIVLNVFGMLEALIYMSLKKLKTTFSILRATFPNPKTTFPILKATFPNPKTTFSIPRNIKNDFFYPVKIQTNDTFIFMSFIVMCSGGIS